MNANHWFEPVRYIHCLLKFVSGCFLHDSYIQPGLKSTIKENSVHAKSTMFNRNIYSRFLTRCVWSRQLDFGISLNASRLRSPTLYSPLWCWWWFCRSCCSFYCRVLCLTQKQRKRWKTCSFRNLATTICQTYQRWCQSKCCLEIYFCIYLTLSSI